jgi:hypothetical protein
MTRTDSGINIVEHLHIAATGMADFALIHAVSCWTFDEFILNDFEVFTDL